MYLDESGYVMCQVVTGWVNIIRRATEKQLHVASYINTALKMETTDSSGKLVFLAIKRITPQKIVYFVNEFCKKKWRVFCGLQFSLGIREYSFLVLLLVDVKLISVLPLFYDFS